MMFKFSNKENTEVCNLITGATNIHPGTWQWADYKQYLAAGGHTLPFQTADEAKKEKDRENEKAVRETFSAESDAPVPVVIPEGEFTFNGGESSAVSIHWAVTLANLLEEKDVQITDIDNIARTLSTSSALAVARQVGKAYRTAFFKKQKGLVDLKKPETTKP